MSTGKVDVVFANNILDYSKIMHDENIGHTLTLNDLNNIDIKHIPVHDILTAGFSFKNKHTLIG